jgi:hypothetical protein
MWVYPKVEGPLVPYRVHSEEGSDLGVHLGARKMILVFGENIVHRIHPPHRIWAHVDVVADLIKKKLERLSLLS